MSSGIAATGVFRPGLEETGQSLSFCAEKLYSRYSEVANFLANNSVNIEGRRDETHRN